MGTFTIDEAYGKKKDQFTVSDAYKNAPKPAAQDSGTGSVMLDFMTRPGTPLSGLKDYITRFMSSAGGGIDTAARGIGDTIDGNVTKGFKDGNVATGIPRVVLGTLQTMASPLTAAVSPVLDPVLQPVAQAVHDNIGKPIEDRTGYPSDITDAIALQAGFGAGAKVVRGAMPKTTVANAHLANHLMNEGVPVYPGQLANSSFTRNLYDMADKLSFYDNGAAGRQSDAISNLLSRTMGETGTDLRTSLANANTRLGGVPNPANPLGPKLQAGTYDQIYSRIGNHPIDQTAAAEINQLVQRAGSLSDRTRQQIFGAVQNIRSAAPNNTMTTQGFKDLTDQGGALSELINNQNQTIAHYGNQLRGILERNIARAAGPADAALLRQADRQWHHMKTLEPAIARGANSEGQISVARLQSDIANASSRANARNASGMPELETLAEAGQGFLKPPKSSGTAERAQIGQMLGGNLVLGGGGYAAGGPYAAAAAILIPPTIRRVLQSQGITRAMIAEALHNGANPNVLRRALVRAARDARITVPAAQAASESNANQ